MEESPGWRDCLLYVLCGAYSLISFFAMVQLIRIQIRVPEFRWTTQKVFLFLNFMVNALRAVLFGLHKKVFLIQAKALEMALLDLPGLLFFSTYTLLVLFWAEIYHQAKSLPTGMLRPTYLITNGSVYVIQVCLWLFIKRNKDSLKISKLLFSVISLIAAMGFLIYGGSLFYMLRHFPIQSPGRQRKLKEVSTITSVCSTCFLIRTVLIAFSAFDKDIRIDSQNMPLLNFVYYMVVEVLPSSLVLFVLRKLPPRRITNQYQPIR